jgi:hypothetical protein
MDQPPLTTPPAAEPAVVSPNLPFLPASIAGNSGDHPFVVIVRTPLEFCHWLRHAPPEVQWIQVENLLGEPEVWATAARKEGNVALDVVVSDPATEYPALYRLVDVRNVRDLRVTIPVLPGFMKSLRLAASLQVPVRLLPGQPDAALLEELQEAVQFYLHDPMVEAPVDFFHSSLTFMREMPVDDLWMILEQDPNEFPKLDPEGNPLAPEGVTGPVPENFVEAHATKLITTGAECTNCRWEKLCRGYFKLPDPGYSCKGMVKVFDRLKEAADEMSADLAQFESSNPTGKEPS